MDFSTVAISVLLAYAACVFFVQAEPRRAAASNWSGNASGERVRAYQFIGWVLLIGALVASCYPQGVERGVAIWIGLVGAAGGICLLVFAFLPKWHFVSALVLVGFGSLLIVASTIIGAGQ